MEFDPVVLNFDPKDSDIYDPVVIANEIRAAATSLKGEFMTEEGDGVDYASMRGSEAFSEYCSKANKLVTLNLDNLLENDRKAFFINLYNCLIIHAICMECNETGFEDPKLARKYFYSTSSYNIGGLVYSLDDIEHGCLRRNKAGRFTPIDPRLKYMIAPQPEHGHDEHLIDPRIHFALNCGAKSCPPIAVYKSGVLDSQLARAAKGFVRGNVSIAKNENAVPPEQAYVVTMSMIFNWYGGDFGATELAVLRWIGTHGGLEESQQVLMDELLASSADEKPAASTAAEGADATTASGRQFTVIYEPYNWVVNDK